MTHSITATWTDGLHFDVLQQGTLIELDSVSDGTPRGVSPKQLLLTALAGCTGMDVASLLPKLRVPFTSCRVHVDGTLTEDHPKTYKTIAITYDVGTTEAYRPLVEKAVQMSVEKYCGVSAMLAASADITHMIVLSGTDQTVDAAGGATTNH